jgi:hypothetical protein
MAKFGTDVNVRRMMGHPADPALRSALTYSRDAMAGPLAELDKILECIRNQTFHPDSPRHLRFSKKNNTAGQQATTVLEGDGEYVELDLDGLPSFSFPEEIEPVNGRTDEPLVEFECDAQSEHESERLAGDTESSSSSSSSNSMSESCLAHPQSDEEELSSLPDFLNRPTSNFDCHKFTVYQHRTSGILHVRGADPSKFVCGRMLTAVYYKIREPLKCQWPNCSQCSSRTAIAENDQASQIAKPADDEGV